MKVLFIMPLALPAYLFQLAALSAFLKSRGHIVKYEELIINGDIKACHLNKLKNTISEFKPDLIGFSSYEMSFVWVQELTAYIKSIDKEIPIIVGGYYATLSPEEVLGCSSADIICIGEGEYPLEELLGSLRNGKLRKDTQSLWFKDGGRIIKNPQRNLIANLDELPFVDRELFTSENKQSGILEIMASRGCPYECTNCSNHAFKEIYLQKGRYLRYRSIENVLSEIEDCLEKEDYGVVQFEDDMFTANQVWLREFCGKYRVRVKLPFVCNIRPEAGTRETLSLLKDAGCIQVSIGVEAGDEKIRSQVLSRKMSDSVIIQAFRNAKKEGLRRKSFNMVGLPHETPHTLWKTIWLNFKLAPDGVQTSVYYPFKGTKLGDECYCKGWVDLERKKKLSIYANDSILNLPTVSRILIITAKWINSAVVIRSGNFSIVRTAILMLLKKFRSNFLAKSIIF